MAIPHRDYLITPGACEDSLGRWMPVVIVRQPRVPPRGVERRWPPHTMVAEHYRTREDAERRSIDIAKRMIDRGEFK
jgi:hypothetical protein